MQWAATVEMDQDLECIIMVLGMIATLSAMLSILTRRHSMGRGIICTDMMQQIELVSVNLESVVGSIGRMVL